MSRNETDANTSAFCAFCTSFPWELTYHPDPPKEYRYARDIHIQQRPYKDLVEAASSSSSSSSSSGGSPRCPICTVIEMGFNDELELVAKRAATATTTTAIASFSSLPSYTREDFVQLGVTVSYRVTGSMRQLLLERDHLDVGDGSAPLLPGISRVYRAFGIPASDAPRCLDVAQPGYRCGGPRELSPTVDYALLRAWDRLCEDEDEDEDGSGHGPGCLSTPGFVADGTSLPMVRLVDIRELRVVEKLLSDEYLALSYVWGDKPADLGQLTTKTRSSMFERGSLSHDILPPTLTDAFEVTNELGYRYLFVDRLCIVQDDAQDVALYVNAMDQIYGCARITLVAAGSEANGVPGSRASPRKESDLNRLPSFESPDGVKFRQIDGSEINHSMVVEQRCKPTRWATRGWTFQEKLVSTRLLILTDERAMWTCAKSSYVEDMALEHMSLERDPNFLDSKLSPILERRPGELDNMKSGRPELERRLAISKKYAELVNAYVKRNLTFPTDMLRAFQGVLNAFSRINLAWPTFYGLSTTNFLLELAWGCEIWPTNLSDCHPREAALDIQESLFPSWSWLAWKTDACRPSSKIDVRFSCLSGNFALTSSFYHITGGEELTSLSEENRNIVEFGSKSIIPSKENLANEVAGKLTATLLPKAVMFEAYALSCSFVLGKHPKLEDNRNFKQENDGCLEFENSVIWRIPGPFLLKRWYQFPSKDCARKHLSLVLLCYEGKEAWGQEGIHTLLSHSNQNQTFALLVSWRDGIAFREGLVSFPIRDVFEVESIMVWKPIVLC